MGFAVARHVFGDPAMAAGVVALVTVVPNLPLAWRRSGVRPADQSLLPDGDPGDAVSVRLGAPHGLGRAEADPRRLGIRGLAGSPDLRMVVPVHPDRERQTSCACGAFAVDLPGGLAEGVRHHSGLSHPVRRVELPSGEKLDVPLLRLAVAAGSPKTGERRIRPRPPPRTSRGINAGNVPSVPGFGVRVP